MYTRCLSADKALIEQFWLLTSSELLEVKGDTAIGGSDFQ
ncbi:hypothetical protein JCM19239_3752 [Vibrio variabilis]|uniref:Uncharacterized protein n=1 Tax=Vibrio variabilis TaxID=990271 RepID=A0ABQ0J9P0_9VIBR|nr:hypothetical protein JCM19239_3752 [Vibrio variabilis]